VERRERAIVIWIGSTGNGRNPLFNGRRQPSYGGTSRMTRECQVRICEGLGVKLPGPTRQQRWSTDVRAMSAYPSIADHLRNCAVGSSGPKGAAKPNPILSATSCLGASPTHAARARRGVRHAGVRETYTGAGDRCHIGNGAARALAEDHPLLRIHRAFTMRHPSVVRTSCRYSIYTALCTVAVAMCL